MTHLSPAELLGEARRLIDEPAPETRGLWARSAVLLTRQALEQALGELWLVKAPTLRRAPLSTQFVCFPQYIGDTALGHRAGLAWSAMSAACHHRGYAMAPTAGELRAWCITVKQVLEAVGTTPRSRGRGDPAQSV